MVDLKWGWDGPIYLSLMLMSSCDGCCGRICKELIPEEIAVHQQEAAGFLEESPEEVRSLTASPYYDHRVICGHMCMYETFSSLKEVHKSISFIAPFLRHLVCLCLSDFGRLSPKRLELSRE